MNRRNFLKRAGSFFASAIVVNVVGIAKNRAPKPQVVIRAVTPDEDAPSGWLEIKTGAETRYIPIYNSYS